jgi:hypothetical protein
MALKSGARFVRHELAHPRSPHCPRDSLMARDDNKKLTVVMPADYEPDFEKRLDRRTVIGTALMERLGALHSDLGGLEGLSHVKQSLCKRAVWLEVVVESHEQHLANGVAVDVGAYTQALNTLLGVYRVLGVERRAKPVRRLREHMGE